MLLAAEAGLVMHSRQSRRIGLVWTAGLVYGAAFACATQLLTGLQPPSGIGKAWWSI